MHENILERSKGPWRKGWRKLREGKAFPQLKATHLQRGKYLIGEEEQETCPEKKYFLNEQDCIYLDYVYILKILSELQTRNIRAIPQEKSILIEAASSWSIVLARYLFLSSNKQDYWDEFGSRSHRENTVTQWSVLQLNRN